MKNWLIASCVLPAALLFGAVSALANENETNISETEVISEVDEPEMTQRLSARLELFDVNDTVLGEMTLAVEGDTNDAVSVKAEMMQNDEKAVSVPEEELLRLADGNIYLNAKACRSFAKAMEIELPDIPFYCWIKLPGLDYDALQPMIEQMPSIDDWEDAVTLLAEQIYYEDDHDEMHFQVDGGALQIAAMLLDQLQSRYMQAIGSLDVNALAGKYGEMIRSEASALDDEDINVLISALPPTESEQAYRMHYYNPELSFSDMCLKVKAMKYLNDLSRKLGYYGAAMRTPLQIPKMLLEQISEAMINGSGIQTPDWKQMLFQALPREDVGFSLQVREDGSFEGSMQPDNLLQISGKAAEQSIKGTINIDGEDTILFSSVLTDLGFDTMVTISDDMMISLSVKEKCDEGRNGIAFTLKSSQFGMYSNMFAKGTLMSNENGYTLTVDNLRMDNGRVTLLSPVKCTLEMREENGQNKLVLSMNLIQTNYFKVNAGLRLTLARELVERTTAKETGAIDVFELLRYALQNDFYQVNEMVLRKIAEQESEAVESVTEETE